MSSEQPSETVHLKGGPCDGVEVLATTGQSLLVECAADDPDVVARYRPGREKGVYAFRGMDRVVGRIAL
jgi:hypothetical protein